MKKYIGYLFVALVIIACSKPQVITEKDMVEIVCQIFISDAVTVSTEHNRNLFNRDSIEYYAHIYEKMGYTTAEFDSSIVYYARNIAIFDRIVDRAIGELSLMETELLAVKSTHSVDSLNERDIWVGNRKWVLDERKVNESINYFISAHGPGVYTLTAQILIIDTCNLQLPYSTMSFMLNNNINAYSTCLQLKNSDSLQEIKLQQIVFDSQITHVFGSLVWYSLAEGQRAKQVTVSSIKFDFKPIKINECGEEMKILSENVMGIKYAPETFSKKCTITIPYQTTANIASVTNDIKKPQTVTTVTPINPLPKKTKISKIKAERLLD